MNFDFGLTVGTTIALIVSVIIVIKTISVRTQRKITKARLDEAREIEIRIRMASGLDVINEFNELARVYISLDRLYDAEECMRKALSITENELGQSDPTVVPILENYAKLLDLMNRTVEADKFRKRAEDVSSRHR